ncbi:unnamed protein product [Leptidea sinapis]|uniref:Uncharacterized protein n=1 Tax=Leptidea sinapis TaxID=189913 RepID=A0A5E4QDE0_9NEOP|nr:unnamed protein product [Leptidea sinapis]
MLAAFWSFILFLSEAFGIKWAPLNVPLSRRLQTLAATGWICLILFGEAFAVLLFIKILYSSLWYLAIIYAIWMLNDIDVCHRVIIETTSLSN